MVTLKTELIHYICDRMEFSLNVMEISPMHELGLV